MKIKVLRYLNFRNFAKEGKIIFDTTGKVTIIYGSNGDGKTTLHQLFQWILYERITFNKTTSSNRLYNLGNGKNLLPGCSMFVWGEVEFEHNGEYYLVRREIEYYKQRNEEIIRKFEGDSFCVKKRTPNRDWKTVENPEALIEEVLPSGLASYFFFDGETMIADLKIRGSESAKTLRTALHSIFELEVYENALRDIGETKKGSSVLGQLERKRLEELQKVAKEDEMKTYIKELKILNEKIELIETENAGFYKRIEEYNRRMIEISEEIGTNKSRKQLEDNRNLFKKDISRSDDNIKNIMLQFGEEIENNYSYLLITEVVKDAGKRLYLQVQNEEHKIIPGLTKELLINLIKNENRNCICGSKISEQEIARFKEWKSYFPPASYKATYDNFDRNAIKFSGKYNENTLFSFIGKILEEKIHIRELDKQISEIDVGLGGAENVDILLAERNQIENDIIKTNQDISSNNKMYGNFVHQRKIRNRATEKIKRAGGEVEKYEEKIALMEKIAQQIKKILVDETKEYSDMLRDEIQYLIDTMLTSKREVYLNEDFQLQVKDSYGDESKSEGQFAVVSFAYIGGIFKVLKSYERLIDKEYPLILDGPFSKLDDEQKRNVAAMIPKCAPQVIIFSKDPLIDFIEEGIGKVWTIKSNEEKNNAEVEEQQLWR